MPRTALPISLDEPNTRSRGRLGEATLAAAALVIGLLLVGGHAPARASGGASSPEGAYWMTVLPEAPPQALTEVPIEVELATPTGLPAPGAHVLIQATMPDMAMPAVRCEASPLPGTDGRYLGRVVFPMPGRWAIAVRAEVPGGLAAHATQILDVP